MSRRTFVIALVVAALLVAAVIATFTASQETGRGDFSRPTAAASAVPSTRVTTPQPTDTASACERSVEPPGDGQILVYFPCGPQAVEVAAVTRPIAIGGAAMSRLEAAVDAVLRGPVREEIAAGFSGSVPAEWQAIAHSVRVEGDDLAVIDFDRSILALAAPNTSAQLHALTSSLGATALEAAAVDRVEIHIGGSCGAFVVWMGEIAECGVAGGPPRDAAALEWWTLEGAEVDGERLPVVSSIVVGESSLSGFAVCSQYEIDVQRHEEAAVVSAVVVTERVCMDPESAAHARYFSALERLTMATFRADVLTLSGPGVELRFSR